jgi:tetratricopeptide (TPR) repeat protein
VLAAAAFQRLASAGRRALARSDSGAAANLLARAGALVSGMDAGVASLLIDLGTARAAVGELASARADFAAARVEAERTGDAATAARALIETSFLVLATDPSTNLAAAALNARRALPTLQQAGDDPGLARATFLLGQVAIIRGQLATAATSLDVALRHARNTADRRIEAELLPWLAMCLTNGPTPISAAIPQVDELRARADSTPGLRLALSGAQHNLAMLHAWQGRFDEARTMYRASQAILQEFGQGLMAAATAELRGAVELIAQDPAAAERELRNGYEALISMGETGYLSTLTARLAESLSEQGRDHEAEEMVRFSRSTTAEEDVVSQILWRRVQAGLLARRGHHAAASGLAAQAAGLADRGDAFDLRADARMTLARVHFAAGTLDDARKAASEALAIYEQKEAAACASVARTFLSNLAAGSPRN